MIMNFLLVTVLFLEIFLGYYAQGSGEFACEDGEEWDMCRSPCETTCNDIRHGFRNNCSRSCIPGCFCKRGLVRADDYTCVPPTTCITPVCQENEEYLDCGSPCPLNCTNLNSPIFCTKPCHRGCFCKHNFVRDSSGKCVEPRKCRTAGNVQCPANEEYVNCVNFCNTCTVAEYCQTPYCTPGCDCKPGYFRSIYGQCVTGQQCIAEEYALQQQCGLNEFYTSCVNPCNDCYSRGRCDDYLYNYCSPGCDCKPGYFRNDNGFCIPEWNCLRQNQPICPPGEDYYNCIPTCKVTCDTYNLADVICDTTCNRGCFCKRGFVRRADGLCVPPKECPARPLPCPQGETFYQCIPTCRTTCRTFNNSQGVCSTECRQGCFCQPGFIRNDHGFCVPPSECPSVCGINEEFRTCGSACPATCENFRERRICPQQRCLRGCFCKTGFVRGPRGICMRPRDCPVRKPADGQCCNNFPIGRKGNTTDDDDGDKSKSADITTTPIATETPKNENSSASSSAATKPSTTDEKMPDKTTTPKSGDSTTLKSNDVTTLKSNDVTTTLKSNDVTTTPKSVATTTIPKAAADTATAAPTTTPDKSKTEPNKPATNIPETSANVTEAQTNNAELTTVADLTNSTTAKP